MKRYLLQFLLISCVLLLGIKNANASQYKVTIASLTTTAGASGLSATPVLATSSNYAVAGFSLVGSGTTAGASTITSMTFGQNGTTNTFDNAIYTTAYLYQSTSATWLGTTNAASTLISTETADAAQTPVFTGLNIAVSNTSAIQYFFIVLSNTFGNAAPGTFYMQYASITTTGTALALTGGTPTGPAYTFTSPATATTVIATSLNTATNPAAPTAGLQANPIAATGTKLPIYGLQLATSATGSERSITALNFTAVTAPAQNNNYFFGNMYLYSSTSNTYSAATSTLVSTIAAGATTTANFTGLNILLDPGKTLYYFVLVDYNTTVAAAETYQLNFTSATSNTTVTGTPAGYNYNFTGPVTITATSLNTATNPTQPTNGLTPNPIAANATGLPIYGLQLALGTTGTSKTLTALNFTQSGGQNNNYYMANAYLYSNTTATWGTGTPTLLQTITGVTATTALNFTGLNITAAAGGANQYYFVLIDYNTPVAAAANFILGFTSATGATVTGTPAGYTYNYSALSYTIATNTTGIQTAATPYYLGSTGDVLESFSATSTVAATLNSFTLTTAAAYTTYFGNFSIYTSTNPNYANDLAGTGSPLIPVAYTTAGTTTQVVTLTGGQALSATPLYFFVVADFTNDVAAFTNTTTSVTYQYSLSAASVTPATGAITATNTYPIAYYAYKLLSPVALSTYTGGGLAAAGSLNSATQTQQAILGFDVTAAQAETVTSMTFTPTVSAGNMGTYFSNVTLYVSTTNNVAAATAVPAGYTVSALTGATVTITGLSQAISAGTTLYYFIKADYTPPTAGNPTFELSATNVGTSTPYIFTYPCGGPINGTIYTLYNGVTTLTALGVTAGPTNGLMTNPLISVQTGAVYGFSLANSGTAAAPTITGLTFASVDPQNNNQYYFDSFTLYSSPTSTFSAATATQVGTAFTTGANNNAITFTGLNISIPASGTLYYFVVGAYNGVPAASTYEMNFTSATTAGGTTSVAAGATNTGFSYTCGPLTYTIATNTTGIQTAATPYYLGSTGDVLESFGATSTGAATLNSFTLTSTVVYTTYFSGLKVYTSTNPNYAADLAGTGSPLTSVPISTAGTTTLVVTLTGGQALSTTPLYFFVVADFLNDAAAFTSTATSINFNFNLSAASVTPASGTITATNTYPIAYTTYKLQCPTALGTATTTGLAAAGSLNSATQTQQGILGFSVSSTQAETISSITLTPTVSVGNMGTYFSNVTLYVNTVNTFASATPVPAGYTVSSLAGATVTISGLTQAINTTTLYYFIKADYTPPTAGNPTFELSATNVTTSAPATFTYTCGGPINGTIYTLYNGVTTLTALGVTAGPTNGLDANPLMSATVGAIYGFSLANSGTATAPTITALAFTSTTGGGQFNNYYFTNYTLYSSPTSTFDAATATQVGTVQTAGANNALSFTGLTISVPASGTLYYFVSATYKGVAAASTYQLNFSTATTAGGTTSVAAGATNTGFNYTCSPLSYTIATNTTGIQTAATPYYLGSTGDVLESFGASATTPATLNSFTLTSTVVYTTYFSGLKVYTSTNPNYAADLAGTGSPLTSVPISTTGTTTLVVTLTGGQALSTTPLYFFVVADFLNDAAAFTSTATSINFNFNLSAASVTPASGTITATNTYPIAYTTYKLQCPTALGTATTTGLAAAGSLNSATQTQQGILGFSVSSTQAETISSITLTPTVSVGNMGTYFSNVTLYVNTTNSFTGATAVPAGYTVGALTGTTVSITGLTQAITAGTTLYYFIKADYTPPTAGNPTFELSATNVTTSAPSTFTYTCGGPINGTIYTLYNGVTTLTALGVTAGPTNGLMANPLVDIQTGAVYGFSLANSGTDNSPTITGLNFTSTAPQVNSYYFDSYTLYSSPTSTFNAATATQVGTTVTAGNNNTLSFTGLTIAIPASGTVYYFISGNYNGVPAASTYQMNFASATTALSTTSVAAGTGTTGFTYTCNPLTYTITTNTTGIQTAATPYYYGSTGDVLESFGVTSTGNSTFTSFTLKAYLNGANSVYTNYFSNFTVYSSTNPNYAADLAGTGSPLTPVAVTTSGTTTLLVTFNTAQALSATAVYYFVVADFTLGDANFTNTTTPITFQFRLTTATGSATLTNAAIIQYTTYNLLSPVALSTATTTGLATANQLSYNQTQVGILGFAVTTVQNETITAMNFTATISSTHSTIGTFFSNVNLYVSTTNNFAAATLVTGATVSSLTSTSLTFTISGLSQVINNTTLYYFIEADYTAPTNFSSTFQLSATSVVDTNPTTYTCGAPINGTTYNCSPAVLLGTATTTGLATNPITTSATGIGIFGFSIYSGPGYTFTTFNLYSTQPAGQYLNTNFANYQLYVNTTNTFAGATQVTGATFSAIANSNTLTITGLSQAIPTGTTYYYFIKADYTAPAVATTYELNLTSVATSTTTYTTGGPIYGTNYTLTGPQGVYYYTGKAGSTNWEVANNWLNAYTGTANGWPGETLNTDIAVFSPTYSTYNYSVITATKTIGQILVTANNTYQYEIVIKNGLTCTITNGITLGDAGQLNQNNTYLSQLQLVENSNNGTGIFYVGGTSSFYNDGSIAAAANLVFNSGSNVNLYGTTADPSFLGVYAGGAISGSNVTYNCSGPGSEIYGGGGTFAATSSILNFAGFSSQMSSFGATMTLTGCTVNATSTSDNQYLNGLGVNSGTITATSSTVINLGTSSANGSFTTVETSGGTFNLTGGSTINMLGPSSFVSNEYVVRTGLTVTAATMNITGSTINMGSAGGSDGASSEIYNSGVLNFGAASLINMNGANTELLNTNITYSGTTYSGIFIANATSVINPTSTTAVIYNTLASNYFTLLSTSAASATIGTMGTGATIVGQYNVQRYLNGGATYLRNYRMLSSPVNMTGYVSNPYNLIDLSYIGATATIPTTTPTTYYGAFIGGPDPSFGGGVHTFVNPLMYLYQENIAPGSSYNAAFTSGKNVGVVSLNVTANTIGTKNTALGAGSMSPASAAPSVPSTATGLPGYDNTTGVSVPPGNGYITYYVGNSQDATPSSAIAPTASTVTASGYINQGQVQLFLWGSDSQYLTNTYGIPNVRLPGITVIGNPYPSTIDLQTVWSDNSGAVTPSLYQLDNTTQQFDTYNAATQSSSTSLSCEYVGSGLGFYVHTDSLGSTKLFYFQEDQKTPSATGGVYPPLSNFAVIPPQGQMVDNVNAGKLMDAVNPTTNTTDAAIQASVTTTPSKAIATGGSIIGRKQPVIPFSKVKPEVAQVRPAPPTNLVINPALLHLKFVVDSVDNDEVALAFNKAWSDKFDRNDSFDLDGQSGKVYLSSYTSDGIRTSVNALGDYTGGKRVKLFVKAYIAGIFQVQMTDIKHFDTNDYSVFLIDNMLKDSLDLTLYKSYNFNYAPGTANDSTRFVLAIEHKPVPYYALLTFAGQKVTQGVLLNWTVKNESNTTKFVLQKLGANNTYYYLDSLQSDSASVYSYVDQHPTLGSNTYRLQQTTALGVITYSAPVTIGYNSTAPNGGLNIYPNPSRDIITVTLTTTSTAAQVATADIYNTSGTLIEHKVVNANSFTHDISSYQLGVYIIELKNSDGLLVGKSKFVKIQ